jgi:hypothetical protein
MRLGFCRQSRTVGSVFSELLDFGSEKDRLLAVGFAQDDFLEEGFKGTVALALSRFASQVE